MLGDCACFLTETEQNKKHTHWGAYEPHIAKFGKMKMCLINVLSYFWNLQLACATTKYRNGYKLSKSRSFDEGLVWLKPWPELVALAFCYLQLGQSQYWAITNGLAWPSLNGLGLAHGFELGWAHTTSFIFTVIFPIHINRIHCHITKSVEGFISLCCKWFCDDFCGRIAGFWFVSVGSSCWKSIWHSVYPHIRWWTLADYLTD